MNSSDFFGNSSRTNESHIFETLTLAYDTLEYLTITLGTLFNLWLLLAVLTCKGIRSRMRNKVVCSICLVHLLNCMVILPMLVDAKRGFGQSRMNSCHYVLVIHHLFLMQDFMANWTQVILLVVFVSQVCDYRPHARFTKLATVMGTYAVLALPWVGSLITIPVTTFSAFYSLLKQYNISDFEVCFILTIDPLRIIWCLDTSVPLLIAGALLVTCFVLRRRRFTRGLANGMQVELIGRGPQIDHLYGYAAVFIVTLVCDFPAMLVMFDLVEYYRIKWIIFSCIADMVSQTKAIFTPLAWLIFPDIRERLKTWRPWYNPKPGIDLTLVYKNTPP